MKRLHSITDFPSYRSGRRSFNVSLSGTAAGEDIIGDEGDEGLPADEGDCCDCPPGGLLEERVLERPRGGDGGENAAECRGARSWEAFPAAAPGRAGGSLEGSLKAVRLPQFLEGDGDLLALDLYWRQVGGCGSRGASVPECRAAGVLDSSDWYEVPFVNSDGPWSAIRARLPITDEERRSVSAALWVVTRDVDLILGVEGVLKSRAVEEFVSHVDGGRKGSMQQEPKPRLWEFRPNVATWGRATGENLKAGGVRLVLTEAMGRLCALVRAQLVRAQHADAAPGAVDSDASISGK
ncbi:predicted protein [Postia placenta Mad-698-R]|uniref:Uncharacterized protein n=1 Tax=Postia placenta MAD-698-R-SB12 TaxID=670580 RepID=A0A1X6MYL9_9APHY|nr:hypothetical protein POSPLADRAFT_1145068 [Postia placenta MAD-698-R-SB12]EED81365.1 predicted protein [Postia placenta Mad-698-R]OSX61471.1 hypothetical protein POSPLADRAFT_1145068 [Postia placenta MAD-698-R-SB12]